MFAPILLAAALSLNGSWDFRFEEGKSFRDAGAPGFVATDVITVPGCFDAMPKWFMKRGTGLYRRTFTLERDVKAAWLVLDGLGLYAKFWLDGREIGVDDLPWSRVEIATGALAAGEHTLVAALDNRFDWSYQKLVRNYYDFHCWGGFYRGVSLKFDNRRLLVRTRDYATGTVEIEAVGFVKADFDATLAFDATNRVPVTFKGGRARVAVPAYRLWSPDRPALHTVALDGVRARFGIRTIEARDGGLYLNGRRIFLKGANRHDQQMQLGAATPEGFMLIDIQNLKKMGGNFFRGAHYPQSQRFLDLCDENGVMVWEESLGWGNGQGYTRQNGVNELTDPDFIEKQIRQTRLMVRNSFNHPSVIIHAFLNEFDSTTKAGKALADQLIDAIRAEDSGKLITYACNRLEGDICNEKTDLVAINTYPGSIYSPPGLHHELRDRLQNQKGSGVNWAVDHFNAKYPGKTLIISEMGVAGLYGERDESCPFNTETFQAEHNNLVAEAVYSNPGLAGLTFWQLFDTRTCWRDCGKDGKKIRAVSSAGLFDANRRPKLGVKTITDWFTNKTPANLRVSQAPGYTLWPSPETVLKAQPDSAFVTLPNGAASVTFGVKYPWPGVRVDFRQGTRDLSDLGWLKVAVSNTTARPVTVSLSVKSHALQGRSPGGSVALQPHAAGVIVAKMNTQPWQLDRPVKLVGMNGYPVATGSDKSQIYDVRHTCSLHIFSDQRNGPSGFALISVTAGGEALPVKVLEANDFLPFVDVYGQFRHDDWPGKIHSADELEASRLEEAQWLAAHATSPIPGVDRFGGWGAGPQLKATGFFRTEKVNGTWWLVDPDGHLFFSHGVDCVNHGEGVTGVGFRETYFEVLPKRDDPDFGRFWGQVNWKAAHGFYSVTGHYPYATYNIGAANMRRKYGPDWLAVSREMAHSRIRAWGLNTIANWSQGDIARMGRTPYTATFGTRGRPIEGSEGWWGKFRDPFSPEFEKGIRESARNEAKRSGTDPWCIGWFVDNELSWGGDNLAHGRWILKSPADQPAKAAARDWLKAKYGDVKALNAVWGTAYADWSAFMVSKAVPDEKKAADDLKAIHRLCVAKYFRTVSEAIRAAAPNRLYLGARIAWGASTVYEESARYCDVVSVNIYQRSPNRDLPEGAADKPMINGEFHFGALDRGLFHTGLVATESQRERAACYRHFVNACLDHPRFVGTHWFQWKDQPLTGRSDGENYQIGFLTITDQPYPELVEAARDVAAKMYARRARVASKPH